MTTERVQRMVDSAPWYYQQSRIYENIQAAQADEYDSLEEKIYDLLLQLSATTATWGLRYWEEGLGITVRLLDSFEIRRGRVIAKMIGEGNFSALQLKAIAQGYGEEIRVAIDVATSLITITFQRGIPSFLEEYQEAVENIIHAHLGTEYKFEYIMNGDVGISTDYVRYVYDYPITGVTVCGTWPSAITLGRAYSYEVNAERTFNTLEKTFKVSGTINASEGVSV